MANTLTAVTLALGDALSTLEEVFARGAAAEALINFLGWDLPPGLDDIGLAEVDFAVFVEKLRVVAESSEADRDDEMLFASRVADLAAALADLVEQIQHLAETLPQRLAGQGDYVSRTNIHKELPRRIFDLMIAGYLANRSDLAFSILNLLNIVEFKHFLADETQFQVEHVRAIVHYDHIHALFSDPSAYMRASYGWGSPDFDVADLIGRIGQLLRALGATTRLQTLDPRAEQALLGRTLPGADQDPMPQLNAYLFEELGLAGQRLGLAAFGVRASSAGAADGGIGFLPIVHGEATGQFPLQAFEDTFLELSAEAELLQRVALILRPNQPAQLQRASTLGELPGGQLALGIRHGQSGGEPTPLLTFPGGSALSVQQVALMGGVTRPAGSDGDSFVQLDLVGARVSFSLSEADSFTSSAVQQDRIEASFDLQIEWSASQGIHFRAGGGLQATLPLNLATGPLLLQSIHLALDLKEDRLGAEASVSGAVKIGPVTASVERLGVVVSTSFDGGGPGLLDLSSRFKPPTGVGLVVDAPGVTGGGFLRFDPDKGQYDGILELTLEDRIAVKGIALIATRLPGGIKGFSLLIILTVEDFQPIPLGLGFKLTGLGGLLAIHRTFDEAVLRTGLKNHALDSILFPKDPIRNAPQILSTLNQVFPPAPGHHLFGPVVKLTWGTPTLITADLALVLELGARLRLLILAQISAVLPTQQNDLIRLQMDAVGVIDFDQGTAALDASLYDSRLLKKFVLTGDMALRLNWHGAPNFALAVGGLHPAFNPPPNFPKLARIALNLTAGNNPRLRCEAYYALTANSLQFGARAELYAEAAGFSLHGEIGYDVLIQVAPFLFLADFYAQVQIKRGSTNLLKVRVEGALAGPRPLHLKAKATFEVLWWDVSIRVDRTLVAGEPPPLPAPVDVLPQLLAALSQPANWTGQLPAGQRQLVSLRSQPGAEADIRLHPLGTLAVKQSVVPLNLDIARFGATAPAGARRFTISSVSLAGQELPPPPVVKDFFAPAQFFDLSDDQKLSRPSFEQLPAGIAFGAGGFAFGTNAADWLAVDAIQFETIILDQEQDETRPSEPADLYRLSAARLDQQARFGAAGSSVLRRTGRAKYHTAAGKHQVVKEGWSIVAADDLTVQDAPGAEPGTPMSYSEAEQALDRLEKVAPARAGRVKILRLSEVELVPNR